MTLPEGFLFSQSNLQDYVDCQRRFQLRHMLHLTWPAVEAEPYLENERKIDLGAQFHKIVRQYLLGIPEGQINASLGANDKLRVAWENFISSTKAGNLQIILEKGIQHLKELTLSVAIDRFRLIAKYDLLIIHSDGKLTIIDWKTSEKHPNRRWLADRLQTHVYPFILVGALPGLINTRAVDPAQVEMIYWFTNQPDQPEHFSYNQLNYQEDERLLTNLVSTIDRNPETIFPLTSDTKRCMYCTYRSLCDRGIKPGLLQDLEEWQEPISAEDVSLDIDQIGEIER